MWTVLSDDNDARFATLDEALDHALTLRLQGHRTEILNPQGLTYAVFVYPLGG